MKTAMQELIEIINDNLKNEYTSQEFARLTIFKASAERLLEKEKEQIEISFDLGRDEVTSVFIIDGEDYYNKKFNQNK